MCGLKKGHSHRPLTEGTGCQQALWVRMSTWRGNGSENTFVCLFSSRSSLSVAVLNSGPKQLGEERVCLAYRSSSQSSMGRSLLRGSSRSLEAGTEAENMKGSAYCLALSIFCRAAFLDTTGPLACSGVALPHGGMATPTLIINQKNIPQACLQTSVTKAFSGLKFHLPRRP